MTGTDRERRLTALLREAGPAHHEAFRATDGADPEWPLWYADYLHGGVAELLGGPTKSELVYLLVAADERHRAERPEADWPAYYAAFMLARRG